MPKFRKLYLVLPLICFVFTLNAQSINLKGYIEAQFGTKYDTDSFHWNMWDPDYKTELRLWTSPISNSEAFVKLYADKWNSSGQMMDHTEALLSEAHISYRQETRGRGFAAILFTRENNHYWTDGSMLNVLNTGSVNNDGNGQGVRIDIWEQWGGSASYVFSDFSQGESDDIHLLRLRQSFWDEKFKTGLFFQRKNYGSGAKKEYNQVIATDDKIRFSNYQFNIEFAVSTVPSEQELSDTNKSHHGESWEKFKTGDVVDGFRELFKSDVAAKCELRGLKLGSSDVGYWFIKPGVWCYGKGYRNYMGENKYDECGLWVDSYYMLPRRAITFTLNYFQYKKIESKIFSTGKSLEPVTNLYAEIYLEFVNGFKGKIYYNKKDEVWHGEKYKHYDFFTELSVENRLAKLLTQFKIKDINEVNEKQIAGIECSVNLTEHWKAFVRGLVANDRVGARVNFFGELLYRIGGNSELYLQYGPSWYGAYGLVNDDSFISGGTMQKELKLVLKTWF